MWGGFVNVKFNILCQIEHLKLVDKTGYLSETCDRQSPNDRANVAAHMEDQSHCEDPEEIDEDVVSLLATLHQDAALSVQQWNLTNFYIILLI